MRLASWSKVSAVVIGDDLALSYVSVSPGGATERLGPTLEGFCSMSPDAARAALADAPAGRIVLTLPSAWCALRPIQLTSRLWGKAREEVVRSLDKLAPMSPEDAMVGLIDRAPGDDGSAPTGAWLVAARRSQAQPWIDALERALGRLVSEILSPHMAMLGLGLQHEAACEVIEPAPGGAALAHRLRWGLPEAMGEPWRRDDQPIGPRVVLPGPHTQWPGGLRVVDVRELATAAALAPTVAAGSFWPLQGKPASPARRWIGPVLGGAAAVVMIAAAGPVYDARMVRSAARLSAETAAMTSRLDEAQAARSRAERLTRLLTEGVAAPTRGWGSVLPAAEEAQQAMGGEGYLYRVEIDSKGVLIRGEAGSASRVLERLEASPLLRAAQLTAPVTKSASGLDSFEARAERLQGGESK